MCSLKILDLGPLFNDLEQISGPRARGFEDVLVNRKEEKWDHSLLQKDMCDKRWHVRVLVYFHVWKSHVK